MQSGYIETERLRLRIVTPDIYNFEMLKDDASIRAYFGLKSEDELILEKEKHKQGLTSFQKSFCLLYLIDKSNDEVMGWCGYHTWFLRHKRAEIGYLLSSDAYKRKGFMKEAFPHVLNYGFNNLQLERIEAYIAAENIPSLKLATSHGFVQEGILKKHYMVNGKLEDSLLFALLKENYKL